VNSFYVKHSLLQLIAKFYGNMSATFKVIAKNSLLFSEHAIAACSIINRLLTHRRTDRPTRVAPTTVPSR